MKNYGIVIGLWLNIAALSGTMNAGIVRSYYRRPDTTSRYRRPDGTSFYIRP